MNCSRVRKWLPLYAGADLSAGKTRRLEKHLERCAGCRREIDEFRAALEAVRAVAGRETLDWPEGEWKNMMARVKSAELSRRPVPPFAMTPKRAWAYGVTATLALAIVILILKLTFSPPAGSLLSEIATATSLQPSRALIKEELPSNLFPQDVPFRVRRGSRVVDQAGLAAGPAPEKAAQEMMSLALVSQETGLKVYWTFNRNFEWEEKKE